MFKELCATLFLLCNPLLNGFTFNYDGNPQDQFVQGIAECTVLNRGYRTTVQGCATLIATTTLYRGSITALFNTVHSAIPCTN